MHTVKVMSGMTNRVEGVFRQQTDQYYRAEQTFAHEDYRERGYIRKPVLTERYQLRGQFELKSDRTGKQATWVRRLCEIARVEESRISLFSMLELREDEKIAAAEPQAASAYLEWTRTTSLLRSYRAAFGIHRRQYIANVVYRSCTGSLEVGEICLFARIRGDDGSVNEVALLRTYTKVNVCPSGSADGCRGFCSPSCRMIAEATGNTPVSLEEGDGGLIVIPLEDVVEHADLMPVGEHVIDPCYRIWTDFFRHVHGQPGFYTADSLGIPRLDTPADMLANACFCHSEVGMKEKLCLIGVAEGKASELDRSWAATAVCCCNKKKNIPCELNSKDNFTLYMGNQEGYDEYLARQSAAWGGFEEGGTGTGRVAHSAGGRATAAASGKGKKNKKRPAEDEGPWL